MIGKIISHYKILEELGRGGMGVVYKAEDIKLQRPVALKFLPPDMTRDSKAKQRFINEARAASALDHTNICTIYEIDETKPTPGEPGDGQSFIAMAYYEGETLKNRIRSGPQPEDSTIQIAIQIAQGLARAHEAGIVHRDIKSVNIIVTPHQEVKILDFGLAKLTGQPDLTKEGLTVGTIAYMSPEQTSGSKVDQRTDIWSLGVIMYEMLTGQLPFQGHYEQAVVYAILNEAPKTLTEIIADSDPELDAIIARALAKQVEQRYANISDMLNELSSLQKNLVTKPTRRVSGRTDATDKHTAAVKTVKQPPVQHTVGRERELALLHDGYESACQGSGRLLCVTGEAGLGKTTLTNAFFEQIKHDQNRPLIARGQSSERLAGTEGYLPILEALDYLIRHSPDDSVRDLMKKFAPTWYVEVMPLSPDDSSDERVLADAKAASQERKKRELAAFLQEITQNQPLILFFDDLHWADISTVDVLAFIGNKCDTLPLLIIVAYRPAELLLSENKFQQVKLNLQARRVCQDVVVEFLSLADVQSYLELEYRGNAFPEAFAGVIHKQTEGSPLFMVDLLRNLRDRDVIAKKSGTWVLTQTVSDIKSELPESIRSMIERKIARLSEEERRLLVTASVQGNEFDSAVVANALASDPADVEERLETLANVHSFVRLLNEHEFPNMTPTLSYSFVHILYQNAFYDSLSMTRKASLSLTVAEILLDYYGEKSSEVAYKLAFLFETGRDFGYASDFFTLAAQNAVKVHANQEAILLFQNAIANAEKLEGKERTSRILKASLQKGYLHFGIGTLAHLEKSIIDFTLAEKVAEEAKNVESQISAICSRAFSCFLLKRMKETVYHGRRALELANSVRSKIGTASAQALLAVERMCVGDLDASEKYFDNAIPVLQEHASPNQIGEAVIWPGLLYSWRLDYENQRRFSEWALEQAKKAGSVYHIVTNQWYLGMAFGNQGRISEALDVLNECLHNLELNNLFIILSRVPNTIGWLFSEVHDIKTAQELNMKSIKYTQESGEAEPEANARINLAHDHLLVGELENAFEHLQAAQQLYKKDIWFRWRYNIRTQAELANYWIARGDLKLANSHASASLEAAEKTLSRKYIAWANKILGDIAVLEDRVEDGKKHFKKAMNVLKDHPCPTIEWKILKASADLAKTLKDDSAATELRGHAKAVVQSLADSVTDEKLRKIFLSSKAIREI